jgi:signal transduction histidine kinase
MKTREAIFWNLIVFVVYLLSAKLGLKYALVGETVTLFWPPSGIALAAILIGGYRLSIGVILGAMMVNAETSVPFLTVIMISIGNTAEALCAAFLLKKIPNFSLELDKVSDVLALLLIAACGSTLLGASFGSIGLFCTGQIVAADLWTTWRLWWLGDGMGVLVISPILLTLFGKIKANRFKISRMMILEAVFLLAMLSIICSMIFDSPVLAGLGFFPMSLSIFPFGIWSALRFGTIGAGSVTLISSLIAINGTANGSGPFAIDSMMESLILWCMYTDLMAVSGLILAAAEDGRRNAVEALRLNNLGLDKLVQTRTTELIQANQALQSALADRRHLQAEMNLISEERQKMIGKELHDGLGQLLTGIAFLVSSLCKTLQDKSAPEQAGMQQVSHLLSEAMQTVRDLSHGLYPAGMESCGLNMALKQLADFTQSTSGVRCILEYTPQFFVTDKTTALNLYRIAQEALNNAVKHAKADLIEIKLLANKGHYTFTIEDNGIGFFYNKTESRLSLGLRSMHSRAELIGAVLDVSDKITGGTCITVSGSNH